MFINLVYDAPALAAPQSFRDGVRAAANIIQADFINPITVNINVGYGEFKGFSLASGAVGEGSAFRGATLSLASTKAFLATTASSPDDFTSIANLNLHAPGPSFPSSIVLSTAQAKAFGLISATSGAFDGTIGIAASVSGSTLIDDALHEITHAMGRIAGAGTILDLFRFVSPGSLAIDSFFGSFLKTPYFSINNGWTGLANFDTLSDTSDFAVAQGGPAADPFQAVVGPNADLTPLDLTLMDVLGFTRPKQAPRAPELSFDLVYYLSHYSDVAGAGVDAQAHYDSTGWHEGRNPDAFFNTSYYLSHNPDVAATGMDPLLHYEQFGWRENRNPGPNFSTGSYLAHNADVKLAGINPLDHYVQFGITEHRPL